MVTDLEDTVTINKVDPTEFLQIILNSSTGILTVGNDLDRETKVYYTFDIYANDSQRGGKGLPTVTVQIVVLDVNDHAPQFVNEPYSYTIEESVSNNHQVCYHHMMFTIVKYSNVRDRAKFVIVKQITVK